MGSDRNWISEPIRLPAATPKPEHIVDVSPESLARFYDILKGSFLTLLADLDLDLEPSQKEEIADRLLAWPPSDSGETIIYDEANGSAINSIMKKTWHTALTRCSKWVGGYPIESFVPEVIPAEEDNKTSVSWSFPGKSLLKVRQGQLELLDSSIELTFKNFETSNSSLTLCKWEKVDLRNVSFTDCKFENTRFCNVHLADVAFVKVNFSNCTLENIHMAYTTVEDALIEDSKFRGLSWHHNTLKDVEFFNVEHEHVMWADMQFSKTVFRNIQASKTCLSNANLLDQFVGPAHGPREDLASYSQEKTAEDTSSVSSYLSALEESPEKSCLSGEPSNAPTLPHAIPEAKRPMPLIAKNIPKDESSASSALHTGEDSNPKVATRTSSSKEKEKSHPLVPSLPISVINAKLPTEKTVSKNIGYPNIYGEEAFLGIWARGITVVKDKKIIFTNHEIKDLQGILEELWRARVFRTKSTWRVSFRDSVGVSRTETLLKAKEALGRSSIQVADLERLMSAKDKFWMLDDVSHNWSTLKDPGIRHDGEYPKHAYIHTNYGELRKQVYSYLIPTGKLLVGDYVQNLNVTTSSIRTHYLLEFEGVQPPIPSVATTYFVRSDEFNLRDIDLGIAGVTKKLNTEVSMKLYERQIQFNGSPKSALAFLHDRTRHLECLTNVSLRFLCGSTKAVQLPHPAPAGAIIPPTNIVCWRKMLNVLVHYCPNIKNVELSIDSSFWDSEPWTKSVHTIYESPFGKSPFLYQARANYGDGRWEYSKSFLELIARFHKAHFKLSIDEPAGDLEEKKAKAEYGASWRLHYPPCKGYVSAFPERSREFREKLEKHMMKKMEDRPAYNQFRLCDCDWKKFTDGKPMLGTSCIYTWKGGEVMKKKAKDLWV